MSRTLREKVARFLMRIEGWKSVDWLKVMDDYSRKSYFKDADKLIRMVREEDKRNEKGWRKEDTQYDRDVRKGRREP